jgi:hypothetical protein
MDEYVVCKLEQNKEQRWIKFAQPVLLQSYMDKFSIANPGACEQADGVKGREQHTYCT